MKIILTNTVYFQLGCGNCSTVSRWDSTAFFGHFWLLCRKFLPRRLHPSSSMALSQGKFVLEKAAACTNEDGVFRHRLLRNSTLEDQLRSEEHPSLYPRTSSSSFPQHSYHFVTSRRTEVNTVALSLA